MTDAADFLVGLLATFSAWLDQVSPIPWPLWPAVAWPLIAMLLNWVTWFLRGQVWPIACGYPTTTRRRPCRRLTIGEWNRCWQHARRWVRRTDRHRVDPTLRRWQTFARGSSGEKVDRTVTSRHLLMPLIASSDLLYYRGFAKPPSDVIRTLPHSWQRNRARLNQLRTSMANGSLGLSAIVAPARMDVSDELSPAVSIARPALRTVLAVFLTGMLLVVLQGVVDDPLLRLIPQYLAVTAFVFGWSVFLEGVWNPSSVWLRSAARRTASAVLPFLLFSVAGGLILSGGAAP